MGFGDKIKHAVSSAEEGARRAAHSVTDTASRLAGTITSDITNEVGSITSALDVLTGGSVTVGASATIYNAQTGTSTQVPLAQPPPISSGTRITDMLASSEARVKGAVHDAVSEVTNIAGEIAAPITGYAQDVHNAVTSVADHIADTASNVFSAVTSLPQEIGHTINKDAHKAIDSIETEVGTVFTKVQNIKDDITNPIRNFGHDIMDDLKYVLLFGGIAALFLWSGTSGIRSDAMQWTRRTAKRSFDQLGEAIPEVAGSLPKIALAAPLLL